MQFFQRKEEKEKEARVIDALASALEASDVTSNTHHKATNKKKKKKKKKKKTGALKTEATTVSEDAAGIDCTESAEEDSDEDGDDDLLRLAAMKKSSKTNISGKPSMKSQVDIPEMRANGVKKTNEKEHAEDEEDKHVVHRIRRSRAEERLAKLEKEHDSLISLFDSTVPTDEEDQIQRVLQLSELVSKLNTARRAVEIEKEKAKDKRLPSGDDLLSLTRGNLIARMQSDERTAALEFGDDDESSSPHGNRGSLKAPQSRIATYKNPDPRTVRYFAIQDALAVAMARKAAAAAATEGGFVALGMEDALLPPELLEGHSGVFVRPDKQVEHERILRVARKVATDPTGLLEGQLLQHKQYDLNFAFLKPYNPLHYYYSFLRSLTPEHLDGLVAAAEREAAAMKNIDVDAVAKDLRGMSEESGDREQTLGGIIYPIIEIWYPHDAPKLTGMMLALDTFEELVPLLAGLEIFKAAVGAAYDSLKQSIESISESE